MKLLFAHALWRFSFTILLFATLFNPLAGDNLPNEDERSTYTIYRLTGPARPSSLEMKSLKDAVVNQDIFLSPDSLSQALEHPTQVELPIRIALPLPPDQTEVAIIDDISEDAAGGLILSGYLHGMTPSEVVLVLQSGLLSGHLSLPHARYVIRPGDTRTSTLVEVNLASFSAEGNPVGEGDHPSLVNPSIDSPTTTPGDDDGSRIDLLAVYDQDALSLAGGEGQILARIETGVAEVNLSFQNSRVNPTITLVGTGLVPFSENGADDFWGDLLANLINPTNNYAYLEAVHTMRDVTSADVVILLVAAKTPFCGYAQTMDTLDGSFTEKAYGLVSLDCAIEQYSLGHVLGHLMGSSHDRLNSAGQIGAYPYSYGYQDPAHLFRTIMADAKFCADLSLGIPCPRINYWSNPSVFYDQVPTGISSTDPLNAADNAQSLNHTALTVANFRDGPGPQPPSSLGASTDYTDPTQPSIHLTWIDNAKDEASFILERSAQNQAEWSPLATLAANTQEFTDSHPPVNQAFDYRIKAHNGNGDSAYSNLASASTLLAPAAPYDVMVSSTGEDSVILTWQLSTDLDHFGPAGTLVLEQSDDVFTSVERTIILPAGATSAAVNLLGCETPYQFRVKAVNATGSSPYSPVLSTRTGQCTFLLPPTGLQALALSPVKVRLSWSPGRSVVEYKIQRLAIGVEQAFQVIGKAAAWNLTFDDNGLRPGASYTYQVTASSSKSETAASDPITVTTPWYTLYLPLSLTR